MLDVPERKRDLTNMIAACRSAVARLAPDFISGDARILAAVSGGADSLALLLLLHDLWPGRIFAATVDHQLRPEAAREAQHVARICAAKGISHTILLPETPIQGSLQAAARAVRYDLLKAHAKAIQCAWIATAHHADDQLETMFMRLARGSGLDGLSAIREVNGTVIRPLLGLRKAQLVAYYEHHNVPFIHDPSNDDERFDRVQMRKALADFVMIDPLAVSRSAAALAEAADALDWIVSREAQATVQNSDEGVLLTEITYPPEILRRMVLHCLRQIDPRISPRGEAMDRALQQLLAGQQTMLGDVLCRAEARSGGAARQWRFERAPPRRQKTSKK